MNLCRAALCLLLLIAAVSLGDEPSTRGALAPEDEAATFRLSDERLTIDLAAAEPQVDSPVAIAWDEEGRMYVAEMRDYPAGPTSGRIRLLSDRDADGRYEEATIFADQLNFPNSVLCWRGGVFVTAAPDLWYLKDTDGDGQADERRVVWTGFAEGNQQLRANGLTWGLDNWVYGANGRSDGEIRRPDEPASAAISIRTRDFRFSPDAKRFEAIAGQSQFGQTRDDWGHRFLGWNTIALRHALLDPAALAAHPRLGSSAVRDIADPSDGGRVFPLSPRPQTFNREATDYYNALCGLSIYRGDALGDAYQGNAFVCESLTNLVHRRVLKPDGPTFVSYRGEADREFLASTDSWFHPVNTATGPDGALYVVDFYRRWVEHPQFVPPAQRDEVAWREGEGHGRIWRIRAKLPAASARPPRLSEAGTVDLIGELAHANGWRRDTAQRLLVERGEHALQKLPLLKTTAISSPSDRARLHALWTLKGLNHLDEPTIMAALADSAAGVREQALQLAAQEPSPSAELAAAIHALSSDPSLAVRFRLALSLGALSDADRLAMWVSLAAQEDASPWLELAVSAALDERTVWPFVKQLIQNNPAWLNAPTPQQAAFLRQTAVLVNNVSDVVDLFSLVESSAPSTIGPGHLAVVAGLSQATLTGNVSLRRWLESGESGKSRAAQAVRAILEVARRVANDEHSESSRRCDAIRVLAIDDAQTAAPFLIGLLTANQPQEVQSIAAATLATIADKDTTRQMIEGWNTYTAATRRAVAAAALRRCGVRKPPKSSLSRWNRARFARLNSMRDCANR